MTARASDGKAEKRSAGGVHSVNRILQQILVVDRAALVAGHMGAIESTGDDLVDGRVGNEIARELLDDELVVGLVLTKRLEHPVAPQPHLPPRIHVNSAGVGVARDVEPRHRHALGVAGAIRLFGQQHVNEALVTISARVGDIGVGFFGRGRQTSEVQKEPAHDVFGFGLAARRDAVALEARKYKAVDGIVRPVFVVHHRKSARFGRGERPVKVVGRARHQPAMQQRALVGGDRPLAALGRRHHPLRIMFVDALPKQTGLGVARNNRRAVPARPDRFVTDIKAKTRLLRLSVRAVAKKAAVGKNWSDVAPVKDRRSLDRRLRYQRNERQGRTRELRKLEIRKRAASNGYRDACKDERGSRNTHASKCNGGRTSTNPSHSSPARTLAALQFDPLA